MVQIIPKPPKPTSLLKEIFSYLAIIFFVSLLLLYLVFYLQGRALKKKAQALSSGLKDIQSPATADLRGKVLKDKAFLAAYSDLLKKHIFSSNVFRELEKITHPAVYFSSINLNTDKLELSLTGKTDGFAVVSQEIGLFRNSPLVKSVSLSGISIAKGGGVEFKLEVNLKNNAFQYAQ